MSTRPDFKTEQKNAFESLLNVLSASGDMAYIWDLATDEFQWFGSSTRLLTLPTGELPERGEVWHGQINPEDLPGRTRSLSDHFAGFGRYECEYRVRGNDGEYHWVHDRGAAEISPSGAPARLVGILRPINSRKRHEAHLEFLANFDELTGHFNKPRLREALEHALANTLRFGQEAAYLMVGIDQLGLINTAYGFEVGDAVLVEVGQRLDRCLRNTDVIGRPGGDQFGIVVGHCPKEEAVATAERILHAVQQTPIDCGDVSLHVTISIGGVIIPEHALTSFDAMTKAEGALLRSKSHGRGSVTFYELSEVQRQIFRDSLDTGEQVKQALNDGRLALAFQPIVDATSHEVRYHECLMRMQDEQGNIVSAGRVIPIIEQLGLIAVVDRRVLELALDELEIFPGTKLAVNVSAFTATNRSWLRLLMGRVRGREDIARRLMIEITETAALADMEDAVRSVSTIRELGCTVALDDFGAGYTTFRHLKALPIDVVKIDGTFVQDILDSSENQMFVRNLVALAKTLELKTVAECVENAETGDFLAGKGVDLLQGYHFGRPELTPDWRSGHQTNADTVKAFAQSAGG